MTNPLTRARIALEGLSVGDALGSFFEFSERAAATYAASRKTPSAPWHYTDDTTMALSIYENLRLHGEIKQDELARSFGAHYDRGRGYGMSMHAILPKMAQGGDWRTLAHSTFPGGSFGNGGPMKMPPLGAYYADDTDALITQTERAAVVSHAHPESVAGSVAVALAAAHAWNTRHDDAPHPASFVRQVIEHTSPSKIREGLVRAEKFTTKTPFDTVVTILGNGRRVSAMDTVPFAVWCAADYLMNYEDAIWTAIQAGGDVDTMCAMVGGIVACRVGMDGIPQAWHDSREPLPAWALGA